MWHVTCDTWHVTRDMWHVTCDTWHVTLMGPPLQGLPGSDTGGGKKTSPMKGKVFFTGDRHADVQTLGHCDSMTDSVKMHLPFWKHAYHWPLNVIHFDCLSVWIFVFYNVKLLGCYTVRLSNFLTVWLSDCHTFWLSKYCFHILFPLEYVWLVLCNKHSQRKIS